MTLQSIAGINVSRETMDRLEAFSALTVKWTKSINLVSPSTIANIWDRHIVDSAQIYKYAPQAFANWVDLGSGGGFPGIVVAAIAKETSPTSNFTLIESDLRKATFLRTASRELDVNVTVLSKRIDAVPDQAADVVSARALAALPALLDMIQPHLSVGGSVLLHKGRTWQEEIDQARKEWDFDLLDYQSMTDPEARIIKLNRIVRV